VRAEGDRKSGNMGKSRKQRGKVTYCLQITKGKMRARSELKGKKGALYKCDWGRGRRANWTLRSGEEKKKRGAGDDTSRERWGEKGEYNVKRTQEGRKKGNMRAVTETDRKRGM